MSSVFTLSLFVTIFRPVLNKAKKQLENKFPLSSFIGRENKKSAKDVGVDKIDKRKEQFTINSQSSN